MTSSAINANLSRVNSSALYCLAKRIAHPPPVASRIFSASSALICRVSMDEA